MKFLPILVLLLSIFTTGCKQRTGNSENILPSEKTADSLQKEQIERREGETATFIGITSNALQLINAETGSTTELPVGMNMDELLEIIENILKTEIPEAQVNSECGAGPLTIVALNNGLNLMFQEAKSDISGNMEFVGWSLREGAHLSRKITTMAGIGIGSTRTELEDVYVVEISKTSLGNEFSISGEMFGILNAEDKIEFMWSGVSCNFR
ncbi:MAG: hypothetical protein ABJ092_03430 [Gillisia sp.]